jgi:hypothetical protein
VVLEGAREQPPTRRKNGVACFADLKIAHVDESLSATVPYGFAADKGRRTKHCVDGIDYLANGFGHGSRWTIRRVLMADTARCGWPGAAERDLAL